MGMLLRRHKDKTKEEKALKEEKTKKTKAKK